MQTDETLIKRIALRDEQAFEVLVTRFEGRLFNFILRLLNDRAEAEDILQEVFLKVFNNASRFKDKYRASTWLFTITRNTCVDRLRKNARHPKVSLQDKRRGDYAPDAPTIEDRLPGTGAAPDEVSAEEELLERVKGAIGRLAEPHRAVVFLKQYEELSCEEIADIMACPVGTVKSRLHYAMGKLRNELCALDGEV